MTDSPEPDLVAAEGPWGGPVYTYRGAEIRCAKGGHVCALFMEGHPLHGQTFGVPGTIAGLIDHWVDERRLPDHMRAVPKPASGRRAPYTISQDVTAPATDARSITRTDRRPGTPSTR
jgi:hypothetical protein